MRFFRKDTKDNASESLSGASKIYKDRNKQYGDSFIVVGNVMEALFPGGIKLSGEKDFRRFHLLEWTIGKIVRYVQNWENNGHQDSIDDAIVYAAMLAFETKIIDQEAKGK